MTKQDEILIDLSIQKMQVDIDKTRVDIDKTLQDIKQAPIELYIAFGAVLGAVIVKVFQ